MAAVTLYDYWMILYRRRGMVGLTTASAVVTAVVFSLLLPPVYESVCEFYVVSESRGVGLLPAAASRGAMVAPLVLQEIEKWYLGLLESPGVRQLVHDSTKAKDVAKLRRDVDIEFTRKHIVRVRVRDHDPKIASDVANAYPPALMDFLARVGDDRERQSLKAIDKSLAEIEGQLTQTYQQLRSLLAEKRSPSVSGEIQRLLDRKAKLESDLASAEPRLNGIEKSITLTTDALKAETLRLSTLQGNLFMPSVQRLVNEIADIEADLAAARAEFDGKQGERHPKARTLAAKLAQRQLGLERELETVRKAGVRETGSLYEQLRRDLLSLYKDRATIRAEVAANNAELNSLAKRGDALQTHGLREQEIRTEIGRLEKSRDVVRLRQHEILTQATAETSPVVVVATATPATEAKFPLPLFNALVAALLGLIAGIYVALAYDYVARARSAAPR